MDMHKGLKCCSNLSEAITIMLLTLQAVVLLHRPQRTTLRPRTCILGAQTVVSLELCTKISTIVANKFEHKVFIGF
jgi:hypothetical protein